MAEYKRYITQVQENGNVMISEDVVATIVTHAVEEVEGVAGLRIKKSWGARAMKILIGEDNDLTIDCSIIVKFGCSVVDVATNVQNSITSAVEAITGVKVQVVNINVGGISRE